MSLARVVELMTMGATAKQALDYVVLEEVGATAEAWANIRDAGKRGVQNSARRAANEINADLIQQIEESNAPPRQTSLPSIQEESTDTEGGRSA
jgi:hypothetical protein